MSAAADLFNTDETDFGAGAFFCAEGVVGRNDDPENRCRVQCVVPLIDDGEIHEIWARRFQLYVGESGYGDYFVPAVGAPVVLLGKFGDTHSLFYAPLYNETHVAPQEFPDKSIAGAHVPHDLKWIADALLKLQAQNIEAIAAQVAKILAQNVEINAEQSVKVKGNAATVEAVQSLLLKGNQVNVNGSTISVQSNGSLSISGSNVSISGASVTIQGRPVKKTGPPI